MKSKIDYLPLQKIIMINSAAEIFEDFSCIYQAKDKVTEKERMTSSVIQCWSINNPLISAFRVGRINDTFLIEGQYEGRKKRFLLQCINPEVFHDNSVITRNMLKVNSGLTTQYKQEGLSDLEIKRRIMTLIPTRIGAPYVIQKYKRTSVGNESDSIYENNWRLLEYIEDSMTQDVIESEVDASLVGSALADFHYKLNQMPYTLEDPLPGYYDTLKYIKTYENIIENDPVGRLLEVKELPVHSWITENLDDAQKFYSTAIENDKSKDIPYVMKVTKTHTDPKGNNVLRDIKTKEVLVVCDWDTLREEIPVALEFGYAVKFLCSTADEDERETDLIDFNLVALKGFATGWIGNLIKHGISITKKDIRYLQEAIFHTIWQQGLRFYEDYLDGDNYFRLHSGDDPKSNRYRADNQMILWEKAREKESEIEMILQNSLN